MQPLIGLGLVLIAGLGSYRAFRFGQGGRRLLGLIPIGLVLLGGVVCPLIVGILQGAGSQAGGVGGGELLMVSMSGALFLALVSGAVLSLLFRPPKSLGRRTRETK